MYYKRDAEASLSKARVYLCESGRIWCGARYSKSDNECKNCQWVELRKNFDSEFSTKQEG